MFLANLEPWLVGESATTNSNLNNEIKKLLQERTGIKKCLRIWSKFFKVGGVGPKSISTHADCGQNPTKRYPAVSCCFILRAF